MWKISSVWTTDSLLGAVLDDGASMSFAEDRGKPLLGHILLRPVYFISQLEAPHSGSQGEGQSRIQARKGVQIGGRDAATLGEILGSPA